MSSFNTTRRNVMRGLGMVGLTGGALALPQSASASLTVHPESEAFKLYTAFLAHELRQAVIERNVHRAALNFRGPQYESADFARNSDLVVGYSEAFETCLTNAGYDTSLKPSVTPMHRAAVVLNAAGFPVTSRNGGGNAKG